MAIHTTRWRPDTCECVIEYQWNDQDDPIVHTVSNVINCAYHSGTISEIFAAVTLENQEKNIALNYIAQELPAFAIVDGSNVSPNLELISFTYDQSRVLLITAVGMSAQEKSDMKTGIEAIIGTGKVNFT